jgi:hypothetical protein
VFVSFILEISPFDHKQWSVYRSRGSNVKSWDFDQRTIQTKTI